MGKYFPWGGKEMSSSMPEVLDYRDIVVKLARIDSEWESLKGLLTFKGPARNEAPAKNLAVNHKSQTDTDNKVVGFAKTSAQVITPTGCQRLPRTMPVTPRESEALTQKIGGNSHEETLMERLNKVERQIHQLTLMVAALMILTMALFAFLTFSGIKDNLIRWSAVHQAKEIGAISNPLISKAKVSANNHQSLSSAPMATAPQSSGSEGLTPVNESQPPIAEKTVSPSEPQTARKTARSAGNVGEPSETATLSAVPEPAPKFVGSITSNKIHYPDCKWAKTIKPEKLITFPSIAAARAQGYIPCPVCRPHESEETP
jgi:hypothetical protein